MKPEDYTEVVGIFATPIYFAICEDDIQQTIDFVEQTKMKVKVDTNLKQTYGSISEDTYILDNPECAPLRAFIQRHVEIYCREVLAYKFNNIALLQSWVSVKEPTEQHTYHRHPNSLISGCFYWHDEEIQSISFKKTHKLTSFEIDRNPDVVSDYAWDFQKFTPRKNTLILFPSDTEHGVDANTFDKPRKSLAFNTMITDQLGIRGNLTELNVTRLINNQ